MNPKRILCPVDFSEFNNVANEIASTLAESMGAEIVYLHVAQPDVAWGSYAYFDLEKETRRHLRQLNEFKPSVESVAADYVVRWGTPTAWIVRFARENKIDLIVISTHGRTGLPRLLMGSVAESVVRRAECPVLAVKVPQSNKGKSKIAAGEIPDALNETKFHEST